MNDRSIRTVGRNLATAFSVVVLFVASLAPGLIDSGSALALVRIPLEAMIALLVLAILPWRAARRIVAVLFGVLFVSATVAAALDRAFTVTVGQSFNVVTGWPELVDGYGVVRDSIGSFAAGAILVLVGLVALASILVIAWSLLHLERIVRLHRRAAAIGAAAITASWVVLALVAVQLVPGEPVAASDAISSVESRVAQVNTAARDQAAFDRQRANDPYSVVPSSQLLTGLKGKDVILVFVESYGQVAVQNTSFSPGVDEVLRQGNAQLAASGYSERSAFLTSSTYGGISWLAHSTLQTGLWIDSQQKYDKITSGNRLTLSDAFRNAGWRTISDVPSDTRPWAIGSNFYHFGTELNSLNVGYQGPKFSYARVPDQYSLAYFQQHELSQPHKALMAEIDLVSSHNPWTPLPHLVPWTSIGDGSVFDPQPAQGQSPAVVWQDPTQVQKVYGESIQYTMGALFSFLTTFDDPNLVMVVLGDHQPAAVVSGTGSNHDVPISIISKDSGVIDRISGWNWQSGMLPSPSAPVWRMDAFRNRFLSAYSR